MKIIYVFVVLAAVGVGNCYPTKNDSCDHVCGRLGNQRPTGDESFPLANQYPWTVGVYRVLHSVDYKCSGALISSKHVLISQFCAELLDKWNDPIEVRLGDNVNNTVTRGAFTIYKHENYKFAEPDNDIAILQLDQAVTFGFGIQPICLPVSQSIDYSEKFVTATGWYDMSYISSHILIKSEEAQRILKSQEIYVPIWTNEDCAKIPQYAKKLTNSTICAGEYEDGVRYACITDLENDQIFMEKKDGSMELVGIYTYGTRCGTVGVPAVYTRVASFLPWIHSIMKNKCIPKNPRS